MWLHGMLSSTRFLGSKVDDKEDKGNLFHPLGRNSRSSQITLRTSKYFRFFIFSRFNRMFFGSSKCTVMPRISFDPCKVEFLSTILLALFRTKFAYISAISNPVFRWDSCKGSEWDSVKKCSRVCKKNRDSWLDLAGDSRLQAARNYSRAKHARSWSVTLAGALQGKIGQLAIQLPHSWNSRLSQATSPSCEPALF